VTPEEGNGDTEEGGDTEKEGGRDLVKFAQSKERKDKSENTQKRCLEASRQNV